MDEGAGETVEIQVRRRYLEARYLGSYSFHAYVMQMERSVRACKERRRRLLLVDITDLGAFRPTTLERHQIGVSGATLSKDLEKVAVILAPEQAEPDPLMSTVARNRGLRIQAFLDRAKAVRWLLAANA
jgi:hypothetical protein